MYQAYYLALRKTTKTSMIKHFGLWKLTVSIEDSKIDDTFYTPRDRWYDS